jgi:regulator of protease activity HflC (stomatin/prohibitin superfamily)
MRNVVGTTGAVFVTLSLLAVLFGTMYTIDEGERGVKLRMGEVVGTAVPGFSFKTPFIESVVTMDIRSQAQIYENVLAYSRDQQTAALSLSVNYRVPVDRVEEIYQTYGSIENMRARLLDRKVMDNTKNVFGQFTAANSIINRGQLVVNIQEAIQASVDGPIIVESVQLENIDFSDAYENSIEQRMLAEVEVERVRQNLEREKVQAEIAVTQARAQADARVAQAEAESQAIRLQGAAEAQAIEDRGRALRDNPALIGLIQAERWDGKLPVTMVPEATVPFLSIQ